MGKAGAWRIIWDVPNACYRLTERTALGTTGTAVQTESDAWRQWLAQASSFAFHSKSGGHFTARKERRTRGGGYWTAYRKVGGKLKRKYLGVAAELSLGQFEAIAATLAEPQAARAILPLAVPELAMSAPGSSVAPLSGRAQEPLLATKFIVPVPARSQVRRSRLEALLQDGLDYPLTLVSAPAGFGKTSLLQGWASQLRADSVPVAWLSLDESDNTVVRFWIYILTALNRCLPGLSKDALTLLQSPQAPALDFVLTTLINALAQLPQRVVLILDDYQEIHEPAIHASLDFLIERQPPTLRLILLTRGDPPLKLFRARARGAMLEIRSDDLRCNLEEATQLLGQVTGGHIAEPLLAQALARTEGWLVGLQLLGLSLRGRADPADLLRAFDGTERHILDYLTEEVLRQQPAARQEFLLCTSILDPLSGSLCDAVMEQKNSHDILEGLAQANVFVSTLDLQRRWYRYHALFAESLRYQLERIDASRVLLLHRRASRWYAAQHQISEAIQHALGGQDWEFAADLIESASWTLLSSKGKILWSWLEQFPAEVVRMRPRLCQLNVSLINRVGPLKQAEPWLDALEHAFGNSPGRAETNPDVPELTSRKQEQMLGQVAALRALITAYYGDGARATAFWNSALTHLVESDHFELALIAAAQATVAEAEGQASAAGRRLLEASRLHQATGNLADAVLNMASAAVSLHLEGRLQEAWQTCQKAIELVTPTGGPPSALAGFAYARQANLLREWNQLDAALGLVQESIQLGEEIGYPLALLPGYEVIVPIQLSLGDFPGAAESLKQLRQLPCIADNLCLRAWWFTHSQVRLWLLQGDLEQASRWAERLPYESRSVSPFAREREDVARVRVLIALRQSGKALSLLRPLIVTATASGRKDHVIEMRLLEALAHLLREDEDAASAAMATGIRLGEPDGYIRSFVDEGPGMAMLLSGFREQQRRHGPTPYLDTLIAAFPKKAVSIRQGAPPALPAALSERELAVVRELARGASNREIADRMVLSVETVKRHMYNIFLKLGVNNRTQAVVRAQYLGLLLDA